MYAYASFPRFIPTTSADRCFQYACACRLCVRLFPSFILFLHVIRTKDLGRNPIHCDSYCSAFASGHFSPSHRFCERFCGRIQNGFGSPQGTENTLGEQSTLDKLGSHCNSAGFVGSVAPAVWPPSLRRCSPGFPRSHEVLRLFVWLLLPAFTYYE